MHASEGSRSTILVAVGALVRVTVDVGVLVRVGVRVRVDVRVDVLVGVRVIVGVFVSVGIPVMVRVGVTVPVRVAVGDAGGTSQETTSLVMHPLCKPRSSSSTSEGGMTFSPGTLTNDARSLIRP